MNTPFSQDTIRDLDSALLAMQAALLGRSLYGPDHDTLRRQTESAVDLFRQIFERHDYALRVLAVDGKVMLGNQRLPSCGQLSSGLFASLGQRGVDGLKLRPGVHAEEVRVFLDQLTNSDDPSGSASAPLGTAHLRPACLHDEHDESPDGPEGIVGGKLQRPADTRAAAEGFSGNWTAIADGGTPDHEQLGRLVDQISAAVTVGGDAMLPMADLKSHDEYTFIHTVNVGILAAGLAEAVGLSTQVVQDLTLSALLHDVGKKRTPLEVLNKAGKLEEHELRIMRRHPTDGARILFDSPGVPDIASVVAFEHHIHRDGTGYPHVRPGYVPHLGSQIVQLADVFDALRTHRPYRRAMPLPKVLEIMGEGGGSWYDRELLAVFFERVVIRSSRDAQPESDGDAALPDIADIADAA